MVRPMTLDAAPRTVVPPQSVVEQVTEAVLARVLDGSLPPGQDVAIQDLSALLGVSHVPVREALRRLESRGLVIFRRGRRPQIASMDIEDFDAIFRLRRVLEGDVAERSARLFTPQRLAVLREHGTDFALAMQRTGAVSVQWTHTLLHLSLLPGAGKWDRQVLQQLWDAGERYVHLYMTHERHSQKAGEWFVASHARLIDAAGSTSPKQFRKVVVEHIDEATAELRPVVLEVIQPVSGAR